MWTFLAVNGISPLVILHLLLNIKSRSAKKEEIEQWGSRCRRKTVSYDHAAPSQSLSCILHKWLDKLYCKDLRKIYRLSLQSSNCNVRTDPSILPFSCQLFGLNNNDKVSLLQQTSKRQMRRVSRRIEPVTLMAIVSVSSKPFAQVIIFIAHIYFSDAQACTVYTLVSKGSP